jgi:D-amino peptidase
MASRKLYIMTDLEGVAGVMNGADWLYPTSRYYETARKFLTEEVNAAVRGFFDAGFTEIVVADGHGAGAINIDLLNPRAKLMRGWPAGRPYTFGMDRSYNAIAYVGQHAKAGTEYSHITHTGWFNCLDMSINGVSIGEYGQGALCAGELDIPVIFAAGEKAFIDEVKMLTPHVITAAVKEGTIPGSGNELTGEQYEVFHEGAIHLSPIKAREIIYAQARVAGELFHKEPAKFVPLKLSPPYKLIQRFRPYKGESAKTLVREHPTSVIDLLNGSI